MEISFCLLLRNSSILINKFFLKRFAYHFRVLTKLNAVTSTCLHVGDCFCREVLKNQVNSKQSRWQILKSMAIFAGSSLPPFQKFQNFWWNGKCLLLHLAINQSDNIMKLTCMVLIIFCVTLCSISVCYTFNKTRACESKDHDDKWTGYGGT